MHFLTIIQSMKFRLLSFYFFSRFQTISPYGFKEPSWIWDYFQKQMCFVSCFLEIDVFFFLLLLHQLWIWMLWWVQVYLVCRKWIVYRVAHFYTNSLIIFYYLKLVIILKKKKKIVDGPIILNKSLNVQEWRLWESSMYM